MPSENILTQTRRAFRIPDSVVIVFAERLNLTGSQIGSQPTGSKYTIPQGATRDMQIATSVMGTPVYSNIHFLDVQYTDNHGRTIQTQGKTYDAVLITVTQAKKIIRTEIQGRDGTVPEYIGLDDYKVQVNGIITSANGVRPTDEILTLKKMLDAPVAIDVACDYLQALGIHSLIVDSYEMGQEAGGYAYQTFSIACSSFVPVQLRLNGI